MNWKRNPLYILAIIISVGSVLLYFFTGFPYLFFFIPFSFLFPMGRKTTPREQPSQSSTSRSEYCWSCGYHYLGFEAYCPICGAKRA